jgi:gluconolactonase
VPVWDHYEAVDRSFTYLIGGHIAPATLYSDGLFLEGPAYFAAGRYLIFSDIPNDRLLRYDETNGSVSTFRQDCGNPNGNTVDREGRLLTCEHSGRRVTRTEIDGRVITLADSWNGKRLNSPNDAVVKSDGSVWFTDPSYGIESDLDGKRGDSEIGSCNVYCVDPHTGRVDAVITDMVMPNGLAFSRDEKTLYVADSGRTHGPDKPTHIRAFSVRDNNTVTGGEVLVPEPSLGHFDGFRIDSHGHIWAGAFDGVHCYNADGALLGRVKLPTVVANVAFGGRRRNNLFICASTTLYMVRLRSE